jgi:hypothetical protein
MKNWKTKLIGTFMTLGILVSLVSLMVVPAAASPGNVIYFSPDPAEVPQCCDTVEVKIMAESDVPLTATLLTFSFDNTCLEIVDAAGNTADWYLVTIPELDIGLDAVDCDAINAAGEMTISTSVGLSPALAPGTYLIATVWLHCIDCAGCTSVLDLTEGEYTDDMFTSHYPTLEDGDFSCGPEVMRELVSGTMDGGFVRVDDFVPCQDVYVWGQGFMPGMEYRMYIQPYVPGVEVHENQVLDPAAGAPLGYSPIDVVAAADGTIGPQLLFHAEEQHICMYWEIVADKVEGPCEDIPPIGCAGIGSATNPGVYMPNEDGLDAVACDVYGFHIVPEALSLILLSTGLIGLGGYYRLRRRKKTLSDE